jgi:two-component system LytT family response regulator
MKTKVLIIDDEPLARARIRDLLKDERQFEIIGESCNGNDAVMIIEEKKPDLIFLDVQMPELNGFDMLEKIHVDEMPQVIFVTAYDKYAIRAFEYHALDYLLKPFDRNRFRNTLKRAKEQINLRRTKNLRYQLRELLDDVKPTSKYLERIVVKSAGRIIFLKTEQIHWIEAAGNYVMLHVNEDNHLIRETMTEMERKLNPNKFMRVHRSAIVNIDYIKEIQPWVNHEYLVVLKDDTKLTLGRKYRDNLKGFY